MYEFLTGPMVWVSFAVFVIGVTYRAVKYIRGLNWKLDRVAYRAHFGYGLKGALRSIVMWLIPFGTRNWRVKPGFTILFFVFHAGLLIVPIFLLAHAILIKQAWGISWPSLPGVLADGLSIAMLVAGVFMIIRRLALPEVRIVTTAYDYLLLAIAMAPFFTGLMARFGAPGYDIWLMAHLITGHLMLLAIPFTKLAHVIMFFMVRGQIGMDFGIKRGGMKKGGSLAW